MANYQSRKAVARIAVPPTAPMHARKRAVATGKGRSLDEFRELHDASYLVPKRIKSALAELGPDGWEYEVEFVRRAGLSQAEYGRFKGQFSDHLIKTVGHKARFVVAGSVKFADKLRERMQ